MSPGKGAGWGGQSPAVSPPCPQPPEPGAGGRGEQGGGQDHLRLRDGLQRQLRALLHGGEWGDTGRGGFGGDTAGFGGGRPHHPPVPTGRQLPHQHAGGDVDGCQGEAVLHLRGGEKCHHELHVGFPAHPLPRGGEGRGGGDTPTPPHPTPGWVSGGAGGHGWAVGDGCCRRQGRRYTSDVAKLYSINVTNVLGGVASFCRRCAPQPAGSCAPCPPGNAVDRSSGVCRPCPPGTYLRGHPSDGTPDCHPCGPGTRSNQVSVPTRPLGVGGRGVMSPRVMPAPLPPLPKWVMLWDPGG